MLADYLPAMITAWSIQLFAIFSPGPAVAMILGVATAQGRRPALILSAGIAAGAAAMATATVLGISALVAEVSWALMVIRMIGAAYLLWLAYKAFRTAIYPPEIHVAEMKTKSAFKGFAAGFILQISNPKALVFWMAIASVGATFGAPLHISAIFIAGAFVQSFLGHGAYAVLLSSSPVRAAYSRARRWIEGALGAFFCFASFKLATARD